MRGTLGLLVTLAARAVVYGAVVFLASRRRPDIRLHRPWVAPLVGLTLAVLDTALYRGLEVVLGLATLGALGLVLPVATTAVLLAATLRVFAPRRWFAIDGLWSSAWLTVALTVAHGAIWLGLDYLPRHL